MNCTLDKVFDMHLCCVFSFGTFYMGKRDGFVCSTALTCVMLFVLYPA